MDKRTVYVVVHCSPEENQNGTFHYITCFEEVVAREVADNIRKEQGNDYFIYLELQHQTKKPEYNEWSWELDYENHSEPIVHLEYLN